MGLADTKEEAKSTLHEKTESAGAHGFHGFGSTLDVTAATSHFYGSAAPVRESAISNTCTGNQEANADKTESKQSPPPPLPMKWQPAIIHLPNGDSSGATTREETTTQNALPSPQTDILASTNSSEPMEEDEETSPPETAMEIAPAPPEVATDDRPSEKPSPPEVATNDVPSPPEVATNDVPAWPKVETTEVPTPAPDVTMADLNEILVEIPVQDKAS